MKKLLLVMLLGLGLANVSQAGFFDNTCNSVEEKTDKLEVNFKQINRMREEAKNDRSKENEYQFKLMKAEFEVRVINDELQQECKKQNYHCKVCSKWKEIAELEEQQRKAREKANKESFERATNMMKRK